MSFISSFCVSKNRIEDYFPQIIEQQFEDQQKCCLLIGSENTFQSILLE